MGAAFVDRYATQSVRSGFAWQPRVQGPKRPAEPEAEHVDLTQRPPENQQWPAQSHAGMPERLGEPSLGVTNRKKAVVDREEEQTTSMVGGGLGSEATVETFACSRWAWEAANTRLPAAVPVCAPEDHDREPSVERNRDQKLGEWGHQADVCES
jgi:hypothetical protein